MSEEINRGDHHLAGNNFVILMKNEGRKSGGFIK